MLDTTVRTHKKRTLKNRALSNEQKCKQKKKGAETMHWNAV